MTDGHRISPNSLIRRPIQHLGFIVDDIPTAVQLWVDVFGAGPFFWLGRHIEFDVVTHRGGPCVFDHSAALGQWGSVMVELVEVHRIEPPSLRAGMLGAAATGNGVNHVSYIVDDAALESARLEVRDRPAILHARKGPIEITFHAMPGAGTSLEIHQHGEAIDGLFALVTAAAKDWDGSDPLREQPSPPS